MTLELQADVETPLSPSQSILALPFYQTSQAIWELCDGRRTVSDIYLELCHRDQRPDQERLVDFTKTFLQLYDQGVLELSGGEVAGWEKTRFIDLRDLTFYIINCQDHLKKRKFMEHQLLDKKLNFEFVTGVVCRPSYVGIALSHLKILRLPNIQVPFVIMEDDCQFTEAFQYQFEIPDNTDALYLGVSFFGTRSPGEFSWGVANNTQFRQYNENYLRVYNMLARHGIVYLSQRFHLSTIEASLRALTSYEKPCPADIEYAILQASHLVLTPNNPICYQSEWHRGNHRPTKFPLRALRPSSAMP